MIFKLGMQHQGFKLYKDGIIGDPGLTLTYSTTRPNWSPVHLNRKTVTKYLNGEKCK